MSQPQFELEVVYALPDRQVAVRLQVEAGTTARAAALRSALDAEFSGLDLARVPLGVYGRLVDDAYRVEQGDRLELYRPLPVDPREARRARVEAQRRRG